MPGTTHIQQAPTALHRKSVNWRARAAAPAQVTTPPRAHGVRMPSADAPHVFADRSYLAVLICIDCAALVRQCRQAQVQVQDQAEGQARASECEGASMNKAVAMARLGLTSAEDVHSITRAYGECLSQAQQQLLASATSAGRQQSQARVTELVEAYAILTAIEREQPAAASNATVLRSAAHDPAKAQLLNETRPAQTGPPLPIAPGTVLAERLEIGALLGQGGMGNVYAAHDRLKDEDSAIKVLREDLTWSTAAKERFLAEAKVSCSLSHPNIVRVHDVGISNGHYYFSMERLKGQTLRQYMQLRQKSPRRMELDEILGIFRQLFEALEYAHRYIVHRDLKPENIWLAADGTVKLMDFGIARAYSHSQITNTGMTLGTAYYMAPEQQKAAQEVDWHADQYSLGVVLYEMLSGTVPMGAATPLAKLRPDLPRRAANAIMRAMAPKPQDRWPSLDEFSAALHTSPRQTGRIAAGVLIALSAIAAGKLYIDQHARPEAARLAASDTTFPTNIALSPVVVPQIEAELPMPSLGEIEMSYEEAVRAASLRTAHPLEAEVIETEFIEPERLQPVSQRAAVQHSAAPPVTQRTVTRAAQRPATREALQLERWPPPPPEPRFDGRHPPPGYPPPPPRGGRPPPEFRRPPR